MKLFGAASYRRALKKVGPPGGRIRQFLRAHARLKIATTSQLAAVARYSAPRAINLQYGKLGDRIGRELGFRYPKGAARLYSLVTFRRHGPRAHWQLRMRSAFAAAVRREGWI